MPRFPNEISKGSLCCSDLSPKLRGSPLPPQFCPKSSIPPFSVFSNFLTLFTLNSPSSLISFFEFSGCTNNSWLGLNDMTVTSDWLSFLDCWCGAPEPQRLPNVRLRFTSWDDWLGANGCFENVILIGPRGPVGVACPPDSLLSS